MATNLKTKPHLCVWIVLAGWICSSASFAADKLVLRFAENPRTSSHIVKLGDLVEVLVGHSPSVDQMLQMPLGPAPRENAVQTWHSQDVLQHLELRGVHPDSVRWSGNTSAKLQRVSDVVGPGIESIQPAFIGQRQIELAEDLVKQAISEYLVLKTGERTDWRIDVVVPAKLAEVIRIRHNIAGIGGGQDPWLGKQQFILQIKDRNQLTSVTIEAVIDLPPMVLVATRPLRRQEIISNDMLEFAPLPKRHSNDTATYFSDMKQLLGKQLRRSVSTGVPISSDYIGEPIVIERNEMIEVESVSGPVVVRTMARSLGSGAVGELIEIETIPGQQKMLAAITGPLKVRVAAIPSRIEAR